MAHLNFPCKLPFVTEKIENEFRFFLWKIDES